jgi:hypothetical protein
MLAFPAVVPCAAQEVVSEAANWREQAVEWLTWRGTPLSLNAAGGFEQTERTSLCVRFNNYGCVKQGNSPWDGSDGRRDDKGHAVFQDPAYSVRAVVRDYCSKHRRGLRSAVDIAAAYSPWCDTLGSVAVKDGWARSCSDNPRPPADFAGPICQQPESEPSDEQCGSCNCPSRIASQWLNGLPIDAGQIRPTDDLQLFDVQGQPNKAVLAVVLKNKMLIELGGFQPTAAVIERGIELAGVCR